MAEDRRPRLGGVDGEDAASPPRSAPPPDPDERERLVDASVISRLRAEVADLRLQVAEEVRTRRVVVVDEAGASRIRLTAAKDGPCRVMLLDQDGFERMVLDGRPDIGVLSVASRSRSGQSTKVEVFALDPDDDEDASYIGVELVDQGNSTAGFSLYEGHRAQVRTEGD